MKKLIFLLFSCLLLNACCEKDGCLYYYVEKSVVFEHFNAGDLDSVVIVRYEARNNFKNIQDTVITQAKDSFLTFEELPLDNRKQYAYQIYLPATAQSFFIDEFGFRRVPNCNKCFPNRPKEAYIDAFESCVVNGTIQYGGFITVQK